VEVALELLEQQEVQVVVPLVQMEVLLLQVEQEIHLPLVHLKDSQVEMLEEVIQVLIEEQDLVVVEQQKLELVILHQLLLEEVVQEQQLPYQDHLQLTLVVGVVELMLILLPVVQELDQPVQHPLVELEQLVLQQQVLVMLKLIEAVVLAQVV
tara:strand:- start:9 stop:467 length:459 start_codon:yes stop_codon:yes gene_type:complete